MKEIFVHPPQAETMLCLALSPDQKQLAVGFFDGKLKLIEADTGKVGIAAPTWRAYPARAEMVGFGKLQHWNGIGRLRWKDGHCQSVLPGCGKYAIHSGLRQRPME